MTLDLDKLENLHQSTTPGPWTIWSGSPWHAEAPNHPLREEGSNAPTVFQTGNPGSGFFYRDGVEEQAKADAAWIVAAHEAFPAMLAELQRLKRLEAEIVDMGREMDTLT